MRKHETLAWGETRTYLVMASILVLVVIIAVIELYKPQTELNGIMPDSSYVHSEIPKP